MLFFELAYGKNYFSLAKIIVLRLFEMETNQTECSRFEQRYVIKFLLTKKCKQCEIYKRKCDMYREVCFSEKEDIYKWAKHRFAIMSLS